MADSLRASELGLDIIDQARRQRRWNKTAPVWYRKAYTSRSTLNRFWAGQPIRSEAFIALCEAVGVPWQQVADPNSIPADFLNREDSTTALPGSIRIDWGEAPDPRIFYGRVGELSMLQTWIETDRCRLLLIRGMGGMGKTLLTSKLIHNLAESHSEPWDWILWRSLRNAPPLPQLLDEILETLQLGKQKDLSSDSLDCKQLRLLEVLRKQRGLLVLDNLETLLASRQSTTIVSRDSHYRSGYESYGQFLRLMGESSHQSCMVVTSREIPRDVLNRCGDQLPMRCLPLDGLLVDDAQTLFQDKGHFIGSEREWYTIINHYSGNPLALKIVATSVRDFFDGHLSRFLAYLNDGNYLFDDIKDLLGRQFARLSSQERSLMYWLALNREPTSLADLQQDNIRLTMREFLSSLSALQHRSLIEKTGSTFTQQPVVMEYVTQQFIEDIQSEFIQYVETSSFNSASALLCSHLLKKATSKTYIQDTQTRLILTPLLNGLRNQLGSSDAIAAGFHQLLAQIQVEAQSSHEHQQPGYFAANMMHILHHLTFPLTGEDFSGLPILQANLQNVPLHNVNLSQCQFSNCVFTENLGNILSSAFCPGGVFLATCDTDCHVRVWDVASGRLLQICVGHTNWVRTVAFAPHEEDCEDPLLLASGGADHLIKLWDAETGSCLNTLNGHDSDIFSIAWHPEGHQLASASADQTIKIWDTKTGQCLSTLEDHQDRVWSIVFSADGRHLISGSADGQAKVWDLELSRCLHSFKKHHGAIRAVAIHPTRPVVATAGNDSIIHLWELGSGSSLGELKEHRGGIDSLDFNAEGNLLVSGGEDNIIRLWNHQTGKCIRQMKGHSNQIFSVSFNPNNESLVCVSLDQTVRLWDFRTGHCLRTWAGSIDWAFPIAWHPAGTKLASGSNDFSLRVWDPNQNQHQQTLEGHQDHVCGLTFSQDGETLISASRDQTIRFWSLETGQCQRILTGHLDWVYDIQIHPHEPLIASSSADKTIRIWDQNTGICCHTLRGHTSHVWRIAFSPNGQRLASGSTDGTVRIWDWQSGDCLQVLTGHSNRVKAVVFSPTDPILASASNDCTVRLWDLETGDCIQTLFGHQNWVFALAFNSDGSRLVSGSNDWTIRLWAIQNVVTPAPKTSTGLSTSLSASCLRVLQGHQHLITDLAFRPDGQMLASGSQDQTLRLWSIPKGENTKVLRVPRLYEGLNLTRSIGLTDAQMKTLIDLGAIAPKSNALSPNATSATPSAPSSETSEKPQIAMRPSLEVRPSL